MQRILLRTNLVHRAYSTAPGSAPKANGNLAPILLGLGLVGAGGFYYSTRDNGSSAASVKKAVGGTVSALNPDEFRSFKLAKVIPYNHNTSRFVFDLPEGTDSGLTVASALVVKAADEGSLLDAKGKEVIRPYTPTTAPGEKGKLELLVKNYKDGVMSQHIHSLKPGQALAIKGPIPKIKYTANEFEHIGLIAGGSGITPMWQILQEIAANPSDKTKATLIFSNVTEADILLRKEFQDLQRKRPDQIKVVFVLDQAPSGWTGPTGHISQKVLAQNLPGPAYGDRIKIFVCGPPGQVEAVSGKKKSMKDQGELKGLLADLGYVPSQVFKF